MGYESRTRAVDWVGQGGAKPGSGENLEMGEAGGGRKGRERDPKTPEGSVGPEHFPAALVLTSRE